MIDLKNLKPNIPQVSLQDYFYLIAGIPKAGKTSLFAKFVEKYFGDINKGIIAAFEKGYTALKVNAVDIEDWDDFEDFVDQLVEEKDSLPFEFVGLDTCDIMWEMAQEKVIKEWNIENPTKRTKDISGVGAKKEGGQGFGVGYQRAKSKIRKAVDRLMKAGYGIMAISHSKDKEVEEKNGLTYDQLVVSLPSSAREVFVNMADFITFVTIEKEKVDDDIETKRYMYFRTDGYVEAGSRFNNVPEKIEYDVDEFINVIKTAIESEFNENDNLDKIKEEQRKEKEDKAKEFVEKEKNKVKPEDLQQQIKEKINDVSQENKQKVGKKFKELFGSPSKYKTSDDTNLLQEALNFLNTL